MTGVKPLHHSPGERNRESILERWGGERHAQRFNPMLDTERHILVEIAGLQWQTRAQDRTTWTLLEDAFVEKFDVPWASGEQIGLESLDTNRRRATQPKVANGRQRALRDTDRGRG